MSGHRLVHRILLNGGRSCHGFFLWHFMNGGLSWHGFGGNQKVVVEHV